MPPHDLRCAGGDTHAREHLGAKSSVMPEAPEGALPSGTVLSLTPACESLRRGVQDDECDSVKRGDIAFSYIVEQRGEQHLVRSGGARNPLTLDEAKQVDRMAAITRLSGKKEIELNGAQAPPYLANLVDGEERTQPMEILPRAVSDAPEDRYRTEDHAHNPPERTSGGFTGTALRPRRLRTGLSERVLPARSR